MHGSFRRHPKSVTTLGGSCTALAQTHRNSKRAAERPVNTSTLPSVGGTFASGTRLYEALPLAAREAIDRRDTPKPKEIRA